MDFNPRSPHRERQTWINTTLGETWISIHAPLTGSDKSKTWKKTSVKDFNPRSPHRERLSDIEVLTYDIYFNPRSPHRERRSDGTESVEESTISIHAPLTGSDTF